MNDGMRNGVDASSRLIGDSKINSILHVALQRVHEEAAPDGGLQVVRRGDWGAGAGQAAQEEVRLRQQAQKSGERKGKIFKGISITKSTSF